jgi:hypothetical protein
MVSCVGVYVGVRVNHVVSDSFRMGRTWSVERAVRIISWVACEEVGTFIVTAYSLHCDRTNNRSPNDSKEYIDA